MRKKIVYIGLAVIAISVIAYFAVGYSTAGPIENAFQSIFSSANITVGANSYNAFAVSSPGVKGNSTFLFLELTGNYSVNAYMFNASGYDAWRGDVGVNGTTGLDAAKALEGRGALMIYENVNLLYVHSGFNTTGASANVSPNTTRPVYTAPLINVSPAGEYYIVLDNGVPSASHSENLEAAIKYLDPTSQSALENNPNFVTAKNSINTLGEIGAVVVIAFIVGIIVTLYGVFSKPKEPEGQHAGGPHQKTQEEKYIDALYKNVGKRGRKKERKAKAS